MSRHTLAQSDPWLTAECARVVAIDRARGTLHRECARWRREIARRGGIAPTLDAVSRERYEYARAYLSSAAHSAAVARTAVRT